MTFYGSLPSPLHIYTTHLLLIQRYNYSSKIDTISDTFNNGFKESQCIFWIIRRSGKLDTVNMCPILINTKMVTHTSQMKTHTYILL